MGIKAVIFDLYNTLAYINPEDYRRAKKRMAELANVPEDLFFKLWRQYSRTHNRGDLLTVEERVARVLRDIGTIPDRTVILRIADIEYELQTSQVVIGKDTTKVLTSLKQMELKLGLIANTGYSTTQVPKILGIDGFFDVVVLSYVVRSLKPGTYIYLLACRALGVSARDCLFVGDGDDGEIEGAMHVGMRAVLLNEYKERIVHSINVLQFDYEVEHLTKVVEIVQKLL